MSLLQKSTDDSCVSPGGGGRSTSSEVQFSPPNVHEGNASFGNTMQDAGDQDNRLFGRFPGPRAKQGGNSNRTQVSC